MRIKRKYLCIFCGKRKPAADLLYHSGHIGMCHGCMSKLHFTAHPPVFEGVKDVDYVVSPLFYDGKIRDIIIDLKFNGHAASADILSKLMPDLLNDMVHLADFDLVIPVPLSKKRFTERGYNQSALLAKPFAEYFGIEYRDDILLKIKETKRQSRIDLAERFTNVRGAYTASDEVRGKRVLLIDDIFTTGSTLAACAEVLKQNGAENIVGITLTIREKRENIFNRMY